MTGSRWPRFTAAAIGLLWFLQLGGGPTLNLLNTAWLVAGDWRQHWLGFLFFQREPWTLPLGELPSLLHPVGTNIGLTDSNPLLAILVKPFAALLPAEFQLIGPWLALCFVLQGYMGALLTSTVTKDSGQQVLGGALFVLSPVLINRLGHDTLCAQWTLLALLYLGLREYSRPESGSQALWWATACVAFSAGTHPYLAAMSWTLAVALAVRLWLERAVSPGRAALGVLAPTAGLLAVWGAVGYLGGGAPDGSYGFGEFSSDLNTFFNPANFSRILPELHTSPGAYEGFAFLGLGGLAGLSIAVGATIRRRPRPVPAVWSMAAACLLLGVYAIGSHVRWFGTTLVTLDGLYGPLLPIVQPFRSAGRFIWPVHYLLLTAGIWGVTRLIRESKPRLATALLVAIVIGQAADIRMDAWWAADKKEKQIAIAPFEPGRGRYQHLALAPMQVFGACHSPYDADYTYRFMLLAYRLGLTFNSGTYARLDRRATVMACEELERTIDTSALDPATIYIAAPDYVDRFKRAGAACGRWDGNWICVSRGGDTRFATFIETGRDPG